MSVKLSESGSVSKRAERELKKDKDMGGGGGGEGRGCVGFFFFLNSPM